MDVDYKNYPVDYVNQYYPFMQALVLKGDLIPKKYFL